MSKKKPQYDCFKIIHDFANAADEHKQDHIDFLDSVPSRTVQGLISLVNTMSKMPNFTYVEKTKLNELKDTLGDILLHRYVI